MKYLKLKNYNDRISAEADKMLMEAYEISCIISSDDIGGLRPDLMMSSGGVWLLVEKKNMNEASKLLKNNPITD